MRLKSGLKCGRRILSLEKFDHPLDVDRYSSHQLLDLNSHATSMLRSASAMVPHKLGELAFDGWMLSTHLSVLCTLGYSTGSLILQLIFVLAHATPRLAVGVEIRMASR